jgi:glycosyltransferase involved in cell wall biosynthesis
VSVVPHGTPGPPPVTTADVRAATALGDLPVIATFGFLLPHKGILDLLDVVKSLRRDTPSVQLLAMCALHPDPSSAKFETEVRERIDALGLDGNVTLITEYLPDVTVRSLLRAADVIVLPYRATEESASGALNFILPVERPIIATDLPIFSDVRRALLVVEPGNQLMMEDALRRVLGEPTTREYLATQVTEEARSHGWPAIAAEHQKIYMAARARAIRPFRSRAEKVAV